ncbi:MAG: nuclear transport factor 2 family protein [Gammaproteobacteria bacterium]
MRAIPLIVFVSMVLFGCASSGPNTPSYPEVYRQALDEFKGTDRVPPQIIDDFSTFLSNLGAANSAERAEALYAPTLHFSDSLMHTRSRDDVVAHFQGLVDAETQVEVQMLQTLISGSDIYLVWSMQSQFTPVRKTVVSDSIGITHLRFNERGQVIMHQDFWDTGQGFYQHVPVLGRVIRSINSRFVPETSQP